MWIIVNADGVPQKGARPETAVNFDQVIYFYPVGNVTNLVFSDARTLPVKETIRELYDKLQANGK